MHKTDLAKSHEKYNNTQAIEVESLNWLQDGLSSLDTPSFLQTAEDWKKHGKKATRMSARKRRRADGCDFSGATS
jgi:hypothetical protein